MRPAGRSAGVGSGGVCVTYRDAERRLRKLEAQAGASAVVYAIYLAGTGQVAICGSDERLTLAAFRASYPTGVIVKALPADLWEAI